jgi:threonine/homoserine/homoserine lactone efflux protein
MIMNPTDTLLSLIALWFIALMTPGPNMLFFTSVGLSSPLRSLVAAGLGIVTGTAFWGLSGLFGLLWLFEAFPTLGLAVKLAGGAYLIWTGFKIARKGLSPVDETEASVQKIPLTPVRAYWTGFATHLSNAKALVFVTSLFAVTQLAHAPLSLGLSGVAIMVMMSASYYIIYGSLLSFTPFGRSSGMLKRIASVTIGTIMMVFGGRIALGK